MFFRRARVATVGATLGAVMVGVFGVAEPAHAAYPKTSFYVSYGNSFTKGQVTWYNRSVNISGTVHAASGCKTDYHWAWGGDQDGGGYLPYAACVGDGDLTFSDTIEGFGAGGASRVRIRLMNDTSGGWVSVGSDLCTRSACSSE
jgi:hypothetical protein